MIKLYIIMGYIFILNLTSYIMTGYDKKKARTYGWRVPEKRFFILAFLGGATGIYLGMKKFRHKTKHGLFVYGIPLIILLNLVVYYYLIFKV
ncbi:DUF1294 domain-containing protein [Sporosalibacterium faouarense]|uniref:DUF1294 domain-containing protein n=1 Tax=Sporosalibacterium faouarense TaxID=516123 RepID=UPI00311C95D4